MKICLAYNRTTFTNYTCTHKLSWPYKRNNEYLSTLCRNFGYVAELVYNLYVWQGLICFYHIACLELLWIPLEFGVKQYVPNNSSTACFCVMSRVVLESWLVHYILTPQNPTISMPKGWKGYSSHEGWWAQPGQLNLANVCSQGRAIMSWQDTWQDGGWIKALVTNTESLPLSA